MRRRRWDRMKDTESKKKKRKRVKWNRGESKETNERRKKRQRRKKVRRWRAKGTRVEKGRERETERAGKEWSEWGGGVTRGKSPRAIFPHIIIREGLGVSMETTHHPLPVPPSHLIHSAPRLLICRRTRVGTCARMRLSVCVPVDGGGSSTSLSVSVCVHESVCYHHAYTYIRT